MHSPAPWYLKEATATIPIASEATGRTVATVRYGETDLDDARLIAAAPDLLELAREICIARVEHLNERDYYKAMNAIAERAHAAIAKAEGR